MRCNDFTVVYFNVKYEKESVGQSTLVKFHDKYKIYAPILLASKGLDGWVY